MRTIRACEQEDSPSVWWIQSGRKKRGHIEEEKGGGGGRRRMEEVVQLEKNEGEWLQRGIRGKSRGVM